jgi:hypothetical protein
VDANLAFGFLVMSATLACKDVEQNLKLEHVKTRSALRIFRRRNSHPPYQYR